MAKDCQTAHCGKYKPCYNFGGFATMNNENDRMLKGISPYGYDVRQITV